MPDPYNLQRFIAAQEHSYETAKFELRNGLKESHWMWYIFPQIGGLGRSSTAQSYSISGAAEAKAYLAHPTLGARLIELCKILLEVSGRSANDIFGSTDAIKLRSSMTLVAEVSGKPIFKQVLEKYHKGQPDPKTMRLLACS